MNCFYKEYCKIYFFCSLMHHITVTEEKEKEEEEG